MIETKPRAQISANEISNRDEYIEKVNGLNAVYSPNCLQAAAKSKQKILICQSSTCILSEPRHCVQGK